MTFGDQVWHVTSNGLRGWYVEPVLICGPAKYDDVWVRAPGKHGETDLFRADRDDLFEFREDADRYALVCTLRFPPSRSVA